MTELNEDGLIPGQPVDFETLVRVESQRTAKQAEPEVKQQKVRRNAKNDAADE